MPIGEPFEKGAGYRTAYLIWEVKKREGLDAGSHPFEKQKGMTFEQFFEELRKKNKQFENEPVIVD